MSLYLISDINILAGKLFLVNYTFFNNNKKNFANSLSQSTLLIDISIASLVI